MAAAKPSSGRTAVSRLPYSISHVGGIQPRNLTNAERNGLKKALRHAPTAEFERDYAMAIDAYIQYARAVKNDGPGMVKRRLDSVRLAGAALLEAIDALTITDRSFVGSFFTRRFLLGKDAISDNFATTALSKYLGDVEAALAELAGMEIRGRTPAYAEQALAASIAVAIEKEDGKFPACTRGGKFDRVLRCALDAASGNLKMRRDTMPLMTFARDTRSRG